jgi:hypothetical protein
MAREGSHPGRGILRFLALFVPLAAASVAFSSPPVAWNPASTAVVASVREVLGEVADADPGPSVEVYGDGRVVAHFPHYMKRAGDWSDHLTADELQALLGTMVGDGLLDVDPTAARARLGLARAARRAAALRGEATLFEASDPSLTIITLRANGRERTITWRGMRGDAFAHPEVTEVQTLRRANDALRALADRPGLRRVR